MMLMIIVALVVIGLCLGSFVNALVWRIHEQEQEAAKKKPDRDYLRQLSIQRGRSMCPDCRHELAAKDLVPLLSWLALRGKCRYCGKPISWQYPLVEAATALLFVASYVWWPTVASDHAVNNGLLALWLLILTGLLALLVYDLRWLLLPSRLIYRLDILAVIYALIVVVHATRPLTALLNEILAVALGGGIFYLLYQLSGGKWIGGGDVRLGWLLGLLAGTPGRSLLLIFLAAFGGSVLSLPLLAGGRLKRSSVIPFGPLLIAAMVVVQLFGTDILHWYRQLFNLNY
jgi:prepilin signal peptidase PulO-like enzyme (type II secretory pathway)